MRASWTDDTTDLPLLDEKVQELTHFTDALADGMIDEQELSDQQGRLTAALRKAEGTLNDEQHAAVTEALLELTAFNIMNTLAELQKARLRQAIK